MFTFLLVLHALVTIALVSVILVQRSEGGGLGMGGGSPSGLMSARGAADFLTRTTTILATLFVLLSIGIAALASVSTHGGDIDTSLARQPASQSAPAQTAPPAADDPLAAAMGSASNAQAPAEAPAPANDATPAP